ncbi:ABC transporter substrate-binding protein [Cryobacterium sp. AP23]
MNISTTRASRASTASASPPRRRNALRVGAVILASTLALSACSGGEDTSTASAETQDSLVVAVPALAPTLDGAVGGGGTTLESFEMNANLQAGLVRNPYIDGQTENTVVQDFNEYVPYLAEGYEVSEDGLVYTFTLRDDLLSQVGNPITADDVLWSFERKWASPLYSKTVWQGGFTDPASSLAKIDDHTVAFTLTNPGFGVTFLGLLANIQGHIYDSTLMKENATAADPYALEWAKTNSGWGLGPYSVESQVPDQEMILAANPNYVFGEPAMKTVTLRVVGDAGTRASLVATGDVDMAEGVRPADQAKLANTDGIVVPEADPIEYVDLTLVTNKAPFDNELVRQAMAYAIPYDDIITQIYSDRAVRTTGNINTNTAGYSVDDLPSYDYDPEKAKDLLADAGFADGLAFSLSVSSANQDLVDASVLIQSFAKDAGFDVTIDQQTAQAFGQGRTEATFQAILYRNRAQVQTPTYASTLFFKPGNDSSNPSRWEDEASVEYWNVVNEALALPDPLSDEAGEKWIEAQTILLEATPEVFIASIQPSQVFTSDIAGFAYRSENAIDFGNITIVE